MTSLNDVGPGKLSGNSTIFIVMGYAIFLLAISLISASRGNAGVWKSSVRDTDFFAHNGSTSASVPMTQQSTPAVQQQYPPQQYGTPVPQQGYAAQV